MFYHCVHRAASVYVLIYRLSGSWKVNVLGDLLQRLCVLDLLMDDNGGYLCINSEQKDINKKNILNLME